MSVDTVKLNKLADYLDRTYIVKSVETTAMINGLRDAVKEIDALRKEVEELKRRAAIEASRDFHDSCYD